jgi:hypothetical protein
LVRQISRKLELEKGNEMSAETKSMHITPSGGNVFTDLGFDSCEAAMLKAESDRRIFDKLAAKASLEPELPEASWATSGDVNKP